MRRTSALLVSLVVIAGLATTVRAADGPRLPDGLLVQRAPETGTVASVRAPSGGIVVRDDATSAPERRAIRFLERYGTALGVDDVRTLRVVRTDTDQAGVRLVRLDQRYGDLPVFGAQLLVAMDRRGIVSVHGTYVPDVDVPLRPALRRADAEEAALLSVGSGATVEDASLEVYRIGLVEGQPGPSRLAWKVTSRGEHERDEVHVDARTADVLRRISLQQDELYRAAYTPVYLPTPTSAAGQPTGLDPDMLAIRREGDPAPPASVTPHDKLFDFTGEVYRIFHNINPAQDSYDGRGTRMRTVSLINQICPNAYWDGQTTNYCPGFDIDDVVGHEWTHAYTQHTHGLIYACQPGALNESYSDIFGEAQDLLNAWDGIGGTDNSVRTDGEGMPASSQRWLVGEDLTERVANVLGLRDMWNPVRRGHPDRVRSGGYVCGESDNGGVHTNSAVPNHAFAMLTDGKTYRGTTVRGLGLTKTLHIYYGAMLRQTPTSKFANHATALSAACDALVTSGVDLPHPWTGEPTGEIVTSGDCAEIPKAAFATQLQLSPIQCNFQPLLAKNGLPAECDGATAVLSEDFEDGTAGWTVSASAVFPTATARPWVVQGGLPDGRAGLGVFAPVPPGGRCISTFGPPDERSGRTSLDSPVIEVPAGSLQLRFDQYVATNKGRDGGNVKVSVNGEAFTPLTTYMFNAPNETLALADALDQRVSTNPMAGEAAWTGTDGGEVTGSWGTTVADLSSVASVGDRIVLRFDFGVDGCGRGTGWYVDDVRVLACPPEEAVLPE